MKEVGGQTHTSVIQESITCRQTSNAYEHNMEADVE